MEKDELARKYAKNIIGSLPKTPNRNELISILKNAYIAGFDNLCLSKPLAQSVVNTHIYAEGKTTYKFRLEEVESRATFDEQSITIMSECEEYDGFWVKAHCYTHYSNPCLSVDIFKGNKMQGIEYNGWLLKGYTLSMNFSTGIVLLDLSDREGCTMQILKSRYYRNAEGWEASIYRGIRGYFQVVEQYDNAIHAAAVLNMEWLPKKAFIGKQNVHDLYKQKIDDQIKVIYKAKEYFKQKGKEFGDDLLKQCEVANQYLSESEITK